MISKNVENIYLYIYLYNVYSWKVISKYPQYHKQILIVLLILSHYKEMGKCLNLAKNHGCYESVM